MHSQRDVVAKGKRISYACMGKIVNWVTELHLKHAYFPRIGSQIDFLKDLLFCKMMNGGLTCRRTERQRTCDQRADLQIEPTISTQ